MICASGHTHPSRFEAEKCDGLGYAQAKDDVAKLRADLEHARVDRDSCCAGTEELRKKLEVVNLQVGEIQKAWDHALADGIDITEKSRARMHASVWGKTEKPKQESADECPALLMQPGPIKKCGLKAGHDGSCAEKRDDVRGCPKCLPRRAPAGWCDSSSRCR